MRAAVGRDVVDVGDRRVQVTLSAGVAAAGSSDNVDALVARADAALYQAKRAGRNRVVAVGSDARIC